MFGWAVRFRFGGIESGLEYLERMASKGWMLESWQENTLIFHRGEPQALRFAVDIIPVGIWKLDSVEHNETVRDEYVDMYEEMGWRYVENQGRKFLFCTEDETLPLPQTDPIAYEETIYKQHKTKMYWYLALAAAGALAVSHAWHYLYLYWTSLLGNAVFGCFALLMCIGILGAWSNGTLVMKEKKALKEGRIPQIQPRERYGRMIAMCVLAMLGISCFMAPKTLGLRGVSMWGWAVCFSLQWIILNVFPWVLHRFGIMSKGRAALVSNRAANLLMTACYLFFAYGITANGHSVKMPWPENMAPLVTEVEVLGAEQDPWLLEHSYSEYHCGSAEMYEYYDASSDVSFNYKLLLCQWEPVIRSFENNPDMYGWSSYLTEDKAKAWEKCMEFLDHETLNIERGWVVRWGDAVPCRYYFEVDGAALYLQTEELTTEWVQEICRRMHQMVIDNRDSNQ